MNSSGKLEESYGTLWQTIAGLKAAGYSKDFNIKDNCAVCEGIDKPLSPDEFIIDKVYRFEGETNPDDESVLYAISARNYDLQGVLVNGYGPSANAETSDFISRLETKATESQKDIHYNEATDLRPEGDRLLNAPLVKVRLEENIEILKGEKAWQEKDHSAITVFKSETKTAVLIGFHKDGILKTHTAPGNASLMVVKGKVKFRTDKKEIELEEMDVAFF